MTKKELVSTIVGAVSHPDYDNSAEWDTYSPAMPYLLGDLLFNTYDKAVGKKTLRHKMKAMDSTIRRHYHTFNQPLFNLFPQERHWEITDIMDSLEGALANDLVMLRSQIISCIDDIPFEDKVIVADLLSCHCLAQFANLSWGEVYKNAFMSRSVVVNHDTVNPHLEAIKRATFNLAVEWFVPFKAGAIRLSKLKADGTFSVIARHIKQWIETN